MTEVASKALLARHGVPVPKGVVVVDEAAVADGVRSLSPPFVLKVIARGLSHKSDVGGVSLRLPDANAVRAAMRAMRQRPALQGAVIDGFLVEEMATAGHEIVVGGVVDPAFGPVIMVGLGGVFVEIFGDVAFRVCPISRSDAHDMLASLKAAPLLAGARGGVVAAIEPLLAVLLAVGGPDGLMMREAEWLGELDINPLIVSDCTVTAVDARIVSRAEAAR